MDINDLIYALNLGQNSNLGTKNSIKIYSNSLFNLNKIYTKEEFERDNQKYFGLREYNHFESKLINSKKN